MRSVGALCAMQAVLGAHALRQFPRPAMIEAPPLASACNPGATTCDLDEPAYCACCEICQLCFQSGLTCDRSPCPCELSSVDTLCDCSRFCCGAPCDSFVSPASCATPDALGCSGVPSINAQCLCRAGSIAVNGTCFRKRGALRDAAAHVSEAAYAAARAADAFVKARDRHNDGDSGGGDTGAGATGSGGPSAPFAVSADFGPGPEVAEEATTSGAGAGAGAGAAAHPSTATPGGAAPRHHPPPYVLSGGRGAHHFRGDNGTEVSVAMGGRLVGHALLETWRIIFLPASAGILLVACLYVCCRWSTWRHESAKTAARHAEDDGHQWNTVEEVERLLSRGGPAATTSALAAADGTPVHVLDEREM